MAADSSNAIIHLHIAEAVILGSLRILGQVRQRVGIWFWAPLLRLPESTLLRCCRSC